MSQFKSMYTELLAAAIEATESFDTSTLPEQHQQEWKEARKAWKKELYYTKKKIEPLCKKTLDKNQEG